MRRLPLPQLVLSGLLQLLPILRVASADAALAASPIIAVLRWIVGASAVAGSMHGISGATITINQPPNSQAKATNGLAAAIRVDVTYVEGAQSIKPKLYTASNLPPGLLAPKSSGGIWRITGTPTVSGVFKNVLLTAWDGTTIQNSKHNAQIPLTITIVDGPPVITSQPVNVTVNSGASATFNVIATGGNLTYQWRKGDVQISGATSDTLTINPATESAAGNYQVFVQNSGGGVLSDVATLTVLNPIQPPTFTLLPVNTTAHAGESVTLSAAASGPGPLTFQWLKGGQPILNGTTSTLHFPSVGTENSGDYTVAVTGAGGTVTSPKAILAVVDALQVPSIQASGDQLVIPFNSIPGRPYSLELSPDLKSQAWTHVADAVGGPNSHFTVGINSSRAWYRVIAQ